MTDERRDPGTDEVGVADAESAEAATGEAPGAGALTGMAPVGVLAGTAPADGRPLPPVPRTDPSSVPELVARVRAAQRDHARRSLEQRVELLRRYRDTLFERREELAETIGVETGKPEAEIWLHEIVPTADLATYWCTEGPALLAAHEPYLDGLTYPGKRALVERVPRGVVALISPWNFPAALPLRTLFPALLAGNGVVFKPSELTPRTGALLAAAAKEAFGAELVGLAQGGGDVGAAVVEADVDAVVFTGSVATGKAVARAAAERLVPVSLELGGKDPAVVLEDADVERTARGLLWGAFANTGQNCAAVERIYAVRPVAGPLRKRLGELAASLWPGRDYGPLVSDAQRGVVARHVRGALEAGADALCGGDSPDDEKPGWWYPPTVLAGVPEGADALVEESFGPLVPVVEVEDEAAAIEAAGASRYGLTASVWTRDLARGERVARQLPAGVVVVNNHGFSGAIPSLPWGGVRDSGFGVTNSPHALGALTRPRAVVVDMRRAKRELWWHPYTPSLVRIGRAMATLRAGRGAGFLAKVRALFALVGGFVRRWKPD